MTEQNVITALAKQLRDLIFKKEDIKKQASEVEAEISQLKLSLAQEMEKAELSNVKIEGVGTVYLAPLLYVRENKERRAELISWLDSNQLGDLAPRSINQRTLQAMYRERLENNLKLPDEQLVRITSAVEARIRGKKEGGK